MGNAIYRKSNYDGDFSKVEQESNIYNKYYPNIFKYGGALYYAWIEEDSYGFTQVWSATSNIDGSEFVKTQQTFDSEYCSMLKMEVHNDKIIYVYTSSLPSISFDRLCISNSNLDGTSFTVVQLVPTSGAESYINEYPDFYVYNGKIFYAWIQVVSSTAVLSIGKSNLDGSGFTYETTDNVVSYSVTRPRIIVVDDVVYVVWGKLFLPTHQVFLTKTDIYFSSFSQTEIAVSDFRARVETCISIGAVSDGIIIFWTGNDIWKGKIDFDGNIINSSILVGDTGHYTNKKYNEIIVLDESIVFYWVQIDSFIGAFSVRVGITDINFNNFTYLGIPPEETVTTSQLKIAADENVLYGFYNTISPSKDLDFFTFSFYQNKIRVRNMHHKTSVSSEVRARGVWWKSLSSSAEIKTYGVRIDNTNSNPEIGVEYTDDAVGMTGGSTTWDSLFPFIGIRPCVLKEGVVQYYLDPTDYSKKIDGSAADITSGTDGDVMIEIPKMAYSMKTVGNYLYVKVTNNPAPENNIDGTEDWCFHAHTRNEAGDCEKLYIGAYLGWTDGSSKLRSLSGKAPTVTQTIGVFRTRAQANGAGYDQMAFYPLTLLQCLYLIRYKNRDSQTALGRGFVDGNSAATNTGGANTRGMYYGEATGKQQMKFAGIEDFWGNVHYFIDGLFSSATRNILTAFKTFNDTGSGYTDRGRGATSNIGNYMSVSQGKSATGFIAKTVAGSKSTYYSDYATLAASRLPFFGGSWTSASYAGAFRFHLAFSAASVGLGLGGRLMYMGVSAPEPVKIRVNL